MRRLTLTAAFLILFQFFSFTQTAFNFNINTTQRRQPISPYVYGTNDPYSYAGAKRLGGNRLTGYNWENNASHAGDDYFHRNDHYVPWQLGVPAAQYNTPASAITHFHNQSLVQGAYSLITLPMAGYVAADARDDDGAVVTEEEAAPSSRWNRVFTRKLAPFSLVPDLTDGNIFVDEELNYLLHQFGPSNTPRGIKGYSLDNEPALWPHTHPRLFGTNGLTVSYLMDRSVELATRIKEMDPAAEVFGPAAYGFNEYLNLQGASDWDDISNGHSLFLTYYLAEMRRQSGLAGRRLLDVLDLHWYPEDDLDSEISPFDDIIDDAELNRDRMNRPRSLWDPTYVENTWIGRFHQNDILPVIPTVHRYIDEHFPGTKLGLSEYSYMGGRHISGGIAQADALGIFGQQGLYFATYWGAVSFYIKAGFDIYRNYDGSGGRFGDIAVEATTDDREFSSVYAAENSLDNSKLHIIAINKDQVNERVANITVNSPVVYRSARVWMFDSTDIVIKRVDNIKVISGNSFQFTLPPQTVYHFVLTTEDLSIHPFTESAVIAPAVGYSDGGSSFTITAEITDGDNNITDVTVDLSSVGGSATQAMTRNGDTYTVTYTVPAGTATGLKSFVVRAVDADNQVGESTLTYRLIPRQAAEKIWDGDVLEAGTFEPPLHDPGDTRQGELRFEHSLTGGNEEPGSMYFHMEHDPNHWNIFAFRLDVDDNSTDVYRNVSDYEFLEFYIKSNAPATSDIYVSFRDHGYEDSNEIGLKRGGYISSFNPNGFTRVRIPLRDLARYTNFDLTRFWQMNFRTNTADKGFDVWIDDVRAVPFSHPSHRPVISDSTVTPTRNFADGHTTVTIEADVTDPDNDLQSVTIDLSPLHGPNNAAMMLVNGRYTITHTLPATIAKGRKMLTITAADAGHNSTQASLPFLVYQKATSDTVWNGDSKPMGEVLFLSNDETSIAVEPSGGHYRPGVMHVHLEEGDGNGEQYSQVVWDWNEGTNNENIQDATHKRFIQFMVRVEGSEVQPDFDFEFLLRDPFGRFSRAVNIRDYVSSFTGEYQQVRIPLAALLDGTRVDRSQLTGFSISAPDVLPEDGIEVYIDDIILLGSIAADVRLSSQDANCGSNGLITIDQIIDGPGDYNYLINGLPNPDGIQNAQFERLAPGEYDVKITGRNDFIYVASINIRGYTGINVATSVSGNTANALVSSGSGNYRYLWSTGDTTSSLTGAPWGVYTVTITDRLTGCAATATAVIGTPLAAEALNVSVFKVNKNAKITWKATQTPFVQYYEVLHSLDGQSFEVVAHVNADDEKERHAGSYQFYHTKPAYGTNYYMVKGWRANGKVLLSKIKSVVFENEAQRAIAVPNPVVNSLHIRTKRKIIEVKVSDSNMKELKLHSYRAVHDGAILDMSQQPPGIYIVTIKYEEGWESIKVLKL